MLDSTLDLSPSMCPRIFSSHTHPFHFTRRLLVSTSTGSTWKLFFLASDDNIVSHLSSLDVFDYIIVGSGIGGGILAEELL